MFLHFFKLLEGDTCCGSGWGYQLEATVSNTSESFETYSYVRIDDGEGDGGGGGVGTGS